MSRRSRKGRLWSASAARAMLVLLLSGSLVLSSVTGCTTGLSALPAAGFLTGALPKIGGSKKSDEKKKEDNEFGDRFETPLLGDYISVQGNSNVVLRGVGLVTGLDGTGDDPPPSTYRTQLQNEMVRRGVKNPTQWLASRDTALVLVTALLPPMVRKDQHFDVRVVLPPNSKATSLSGGWLLETRLFEEQFVEGRGTMKGHEYAVAGGAILLALGADDDRAEKRSLLRRGTIPGGAVSKTDRDLSVVLRTERRGFRNSQRVATAIAGRFHDYNKFGQRVALADAKTDSLIELKVHHIYRNNFPRYQRVIRSLAFHESEVARRMRMESLAEQLLRPETAHQAALQFEAIGDTGIPFLKRALAEDNLEVRFEAAEALAYLEDSSGVEVLKTAADSEPAFRVYALAALSVLDSGDSIMALRELMNHKSLETRYGAFTALRELDSNDPSIPSMSFEGGFTVYTVDSQGEPMVHVKRYRAPEVVLFGAQQLLRLPAVLNAGRNIRIIGQSGRHEVQIHRYRLNEDSETRTVPSRLLDIIRAVGEMGATYPDVVQMLIEAEQQHNLSGDFGIDRLPQSGRTYERPEDSGDFADNAFPAGDQRRIGSAALVPNMFDRLEEDTLEATDEVPPEPVPASESESTGPVGVEEGHSGADSATNTEPEVSASLNEPGADSLQAEDRAADRQSERGFSLAEPDADDVAGADDESSEDLAGRESPGRNSPSALQRVRSFLGRPFSGQR